MSTPATRAARPDAPETWVRGGMALAAAGYGLIVVVNCAVLGFWNAPFERLMEAAVAGLAAAAFFAPAASRRVGGVALLSAIAIELLTTIAERGADDSGALLTFPPLTLIMVLFAGPRLGRWISGLGAFAIAAAASLGAAADGGSPLEPWTRSNVPYVAVVLVLVMGWIGGAVWEGFANATASVDQARLRFLGLFESVPDGVFELDRDGRVRMANPAAARLFGRDPEISWNGVAFAVALQRVGGPATIDLEAALRAPIRVALGGTVPRVFEITAGDAHVGSGRMVVVRDVSERERIDERIRHAQRLELVGQLAGGVAHDFNNLLTAIGGNAGLLKHHADPEVDEIAREILDTQRRGAALTQQLLSFGRRGIRQPERVDLGEAVGDILRIARRMLGDTHVVAYQCDPSVVVLCDRGQIEQVVLNLVLNARDAMGSEGRMRVAVRALGALDAARVGSPLAVPAQALVEVVDTGVGMTPDVLARAFEPFFTTKSAGTGLGLSTVLALVRENGGEVRVTSTPGRGTTFRVFLGAVEGGATHATASALASLGVVPLPKQTVLVVDDDAAVATLTARVLRRAGCEVTVANDAATALLRDAEAGGFDLVVTDVVMPGMSGPELAAVLRLRRPDQRILFMTGYVDPRSTDGRALATVADVLRKPFAPEELVARVRGLVAVPA